MKKLSEQQLYEIKTFPSVATPYEVTVMVDEIISLRRLAKAMSQSASWTRDCCCAVCEDVAEYRREYPDAGPG